MVLRAAQLIIPAQRSQQVSASEATTFDPPLTGIHANASGDVIGQLVNDTVDRTFVVAQGQTYPYRFKSVTALNAVDFVALWEV